MPAVPQLDRRHAGLVVLLEAARKQEHERQRSESGEDEQDALGGHS